jgi:hypothetical protein
MNEDKTMSQSALASLELRLSVARKSTDSTPVAPADVLSKSTVRPFALMAGHCSALPVLPDITVDYSGDVKVY